MQWVKANLALVITIVVGVLGITGLALGVIMSDVAEKMAQDQATLNSLSSTRGSNSEAIEAARKHSEQVQADLEKGLKVFEAIGNHTPILPEVLPKVSPGDAAPYRFKGLYNEALQAMLVRLHATDEPSAQEIDMERELIENQKERQLRANIMGADPKSQTRPSGLGRQSAQPGVPTLGPRAPRVGRLSDMTPEQLAREDPHVRASIKKARAGRCYARLDTFVLPPLLQSNAPPTVEEMWYAQMMLWIEQDVVNALANVNDAAARALAPGEEPWVGNMPVKRVAQILVGNYVPPPGGSQRSSSGGPGLTGPPNDALAVFTERASNQNSVDVVQFTLDLYLNPKYLPQVIAEISRAGFYTPLLVNYEAYSPTTELVGFIYGSEPVIHANLLFEGCFLQSKYEKWMPETVRTAINNGQATMGVTPGMPGGSPGPSRMQMAPFRPGMPGQRFDGGT